MKPSPLTIGRFSELWKEHYGETLSEQDAKMYVTNILELGEIVYEAQWQAKERAPP